MNQNNRIYYLDFLRGFAILAVVLLHVAAPLLYHFNNIPLNNWQIANLYDSITRWGVPIFFMISGYLGLKTTPKNEPLTVYYKKRFIKVIIPFLFWATFYFLFTIYIDPNIYAFQALTDSNTYIEYFKNLLFGPIYYHLWFLYAIIIIYILNPLIKVFLKRYSRKTITLILFIYFSFISLINMINILFDVALNTSILPTIIGYFCYGLLFISYYILGYLLGTSKIHNLMFINILGSLSLCITFLGTYVTTAKNAGIYVSYFYDYLNFNTVLVSIWIFLITKEKVKNCPKIILLISKYSFGIYLVHTAILALFKKFNITGTTITPILGIPLLAIIVFTLSYFVVMGLSKIKVLKKFVP